MTEDEFENYYGDNGGENCPYHEEDTREQNVYFIGGVNMFVVNEVFNTDGKKFHRFESEDKFTCEVYVDHHKYDYGALLNGDSELIIEEV